MSEDDWVELRWRLRYGGRSEAFRRGYRAWGIVIAETNPYPVGTQEHADWDDGSYWASFDYDWIKEKSRQ